MATLADLQSVRDYASSLDEATRKDFISRYEALSSEGKATLVERIAGQRQSTQGPQLQNTTPSADVDAVVAARQASRPNFNARVAEDVMRPASEFGPGMAAKTGIDALVAVGQNIEGAEANLVNQYFKMGLEKTLPPGASLEFGDIYRHLGAPEGLSKTAGFLTAAAGSGAAPALGKGVRAIGNQALKLGGRIGGGFNRYMQTLLNKTPEELSRLREIKYNIPDEWLKSGEKHVQTLGDEMVRTVDDIKLKKNQLGQEFVKKGSKEVVNPTVSSNMAKEALAALSPQEEANKLLVDQILDAKVNKTEVPYEPLTKVTKTQKTVNYPQAAVQHLIDSENVTKGGLSKTTGSSIVDNYGNLLAEPYTYKEIESKSATHFPGRTVTRPVTLADELQRMASGDKFTASEVKNLADLLGNLAGEGAQANPRAAKLAQLFRNTLRAESPSYRRLADATILADQADQAGQILYGGKSGIDLTGKKAARASALQNFYDAPQGSPFRTAPEVIDGSASLLLGKDPGFTDQVKNVAAASGFASAKPGLTAAGHMGNISVTAAQMGLPPATQGALKTWFYTLGLPKTSAISSRFYYGHSQWLNKLRASKVGQMLNSPAGQFLRNSTAGEAAIKAAQGDSGSFGE